jgi:hypothetical protein
MSHKMVLQHHYGHHMFGDDLAQGARVNLKRHRHTRPRRVEKVGYQTHSTLKGEDAGLVAIQNVGSEIQEPSGSYVMPETLSIQIRI